MAGEVQKIPKVEEAPTVEEVALPASSLPPWVITARKWGLSTWRLFLRQRELSILIIAILLVIYFQSANDVFLHVSNLETLGQYIATPAMIAAGEVMLLICGEIDLSVGQVFALAPFVMYFMIQDGIPLVPSIIIGLIVSAAIGFVNGFVSVILRVPSLITTLGMQFLLYGVTLVISNDFPVPTPNGGQLAKVLATNDFSEITWAIIIVIIMQIILSRTPLGLHTVATGGNPLGAREVGVRVSRVKILFFMLTSVLGGLGGIMEAFRITSIDPQAGGGVGGTVIMFNAVAGAVIGGTALNGGSGTIIGAFLGCTVLFILEDGMNIIGVSANYFYVIFGIAILAAMILNVRLAILRRAGTQE
jgi:simple sugar transport system permease protein